MLTNIRSLFNKLDELQVSMSDLKPDFVATTETWLSNRIQDFQLSIPGYALRRTDRLQDRHGGVALYVSDSWTISSTEQVNGPDNLWELLNCKIRNQEGQVIEVAVFYHSPKRIDSEWLTFIKQQSTRRNIMILGDFNMPEIDWDSMSCSASVSSLSTLLLNTVLEGKISQHVHENSRIASGSIVSCLDLVFTRYSQEIDHVQLLPPISSSDHAVVLARLT